MENSQRTQLPEGLNVVLQRYLQSKKQAHVLSLSQSLKELRVQLRGYPVPERALADAVAEHALADGFALEFDKDNGGPSA